MMTAKALKASQPLLDLVKALILTESATLLQVKLTKHKSRLQFEGRGFN